MLTVVSHDHLCPGLYGCGENMPVVRIGKLDDLDQRLVAGHLNVADGVIHQPTKALQLARVGTTLFTQGTTHLIQDEVGPLGLDHPGLGHSYEQVTHHIRVKHTRVVYNDERHRSVQTRFLA